MRWLFVLLLLGAATAGAYFWKPWAKKDNQSPRAVEVMKPEFRKIATTVSATGTLRLRSGAEVRVGAQLSGIVTKLNVTVGSHVSKEEVIAVIDSRGLSAKIEQAKAQIDYDNVAVEKLRRDLARSKALLDAGLIARQQTEDMEEDLRSAEAKLEKSRQDLAVVESDLPYAEVRAPIAGTIASISTQQGETVAASFAAPTFVTILEDDALELIAMVDETDIGAVKPGDPVNFTVETFSDKTYNGCVARIAPAGTIISGVVNYEVAVRIEGAEGLKPDMTANVTITTAQRNALVIPTSAIQREGERRFVYVSRNTGLLKRLVVPGSASGSFTEIRKGLSDTDSVALIQTAPRNEGSAP